MPILDIQKQEPRLSRLGIIRLGTSKPIPGKRGKEAQDLDYFVLKDAPDLTAVYGDQPKSLLIYLPFAGVNDNLRAFHEMYVGSICQCRGDGQRIVDALDPAGAEKIIRDSVVMKAFRADGQAFEVGDSVPCSGMRHHLYQRCKACKPSGLLMVMVRNPHDPTQLVNDRLGYYQISTHSYHGIVQLTGQLHYAEQVAAQMGRSLQGIPMILRRVPRKLNYVLIDKESGQPGRGITTKYLLDLEFDLEWVRMANARLRALAMGEVVTPNPGAGGNPGFMPPVLPSGDMVEGEVVEPGEITGGAPSLKRQEE